MANPALNPDAIAQAFIDALSPGGVPVGSIGAFTKRTPDDPYRAALPLVEIKAVQNLHTRVAGAGAKRDEGWVEITYRDAPPSQQGLPLSAVEDAAWVARNAIIATLDADHRLGGAVSDAASQVQEIYNPDGSMLSWQGAEWVGWQLRANYKGPTQ